MDNIYYNPEKFGLSIVDEIDDSGSYEFNTLVVFKDQNGNHFYLHDSGCSCPTPFEHCLVGDLNPIEIHNFNEFESMANGYKLGKTDIIKFISNIKSSCKAIARDDKINKILKDE